MLETMPPPDLPAFVFHAATGIRRSSPCAAAAFCARASQVITKPGVGARAQTPFLHLRTPTRLLFACLPIYRFRWLLHS